MKITNIQAKDVNLSVPNLVELLNKHADVTASPLGIDGVPMDLSPLHVPCHHHSSSLSSSSWSSLSSEISQISSEITSDSDDVLLIGDDVADSGFLTIADLQCPECGQSVPGALQDPRVQDPGLLRQVYNIAWTEDADSGLLWC